MWLKEDRLGDPISKDIKVKIIAQVIFSFMLTSQFKLSTKPFLIFQSHNKIGLYGQMKEIHFRTLKLCLIISKHLWLR